VIHACGILYLVESSLTLQKNNWNAVPELSCGELNCARQGIDGLSST